MQRRGHDCQEAAAWKLAEPDGEENKRDAELLAIATENTPVSGDVITADGTEMVLVGNSMNVHVSF